MSSVSPSVERSGIEAARTARAEGVVPARGRRSARRGAAAVVALRYLVLVVGAATMVVPFLWMLATALKAPGSVLTVPPQILSLIHI